LRTSSLARTGCQGRKKSFSLPITVRQDHLQAVPKHGVLEIMLPKEEKAKPRRVQVEVRAQARTRGGISEAEEGIIPSRDGEVAQGRSQTKG